jgi:hypothetical protein
MISIPVCATDQGQAEIEGQGRIAGMLFYNEDGYECGGLVYMGKKRQMDSMSVQD